MLVVNVLQCSTCGRGLKSHPKQSFRSSFSFSVYPDTDGPVWEPRFCMMAPKRPLVLEMYCCGTKKIGIDPFIFFYVLTFLLLPFSLSTWAKAAFQSVHKCKQTDTVFYLLLYKLIQLVWAFQPPNCAQLSKCLGKCRIAHRSKQSRLYRWMNMRS